MSDCQNLQIEVSLVHNPFDRRDRTSVVKTVEVRTLAELANEVVPKGVEVVASINGQVVEKDDWGSRELRVKDSVTFLPTTGDSDVLRVVAFIAVAIVSAGAGAIIGGMGFTGAAFAGAAASVGISMIGGLIINALLPPKLEKPELESPSQAYSWNPVTTQSQGIAIPTVYGTYRVNGNIIAGNLQQKEEEGIYLNALISLGMGPVKGIRDIKINDQPDPMSNFEGVSIETRRGFVNQAPITVGTFGEGLKTEYNPNVTIVQGNSYTYTTPGSNFDSLEVVIAWPQGLVVYSDNGNARAATVKYTLEARKVGTTEWHFIDGTENPTSISHYEGIWVIGYTDGHGKFIVLTTDSTDPNAHSEGEFYGFVRPFTKGYYRWVDNSDLAAGVEATIYKSGAKAGEPLYNTHKINIYDKGQYEIRATFVGVALSRDNNPITTTVFATVREVENTRFTYPREALVGIKALATDQLSGGFNFSALVDGKLVRVWNGTSWNIEWSNNPAWVCWDILTQPVYDNTQIQTSMGWMQVYSGADLSVSRYDGFDPSELDLNSFYTWAQYCDYVLPSGNKRCTFNGTFDQTTSLWRAALQVAEVGRASLMRTGTKVSVVIEKVWADPKPLVTTSSMLKGSFKETFLALEDRAVEIEATYNDKDMDYNRTVINVYNPNITSASKKQSLDLRGITSADEAWRAARLRLALTETLKTFCEFEMSINAVGFTVGDVIDVQSDVPEWGFGGRVVAGALAQVELDQEVTLESGSYSIMVRMPDGTIETKPINESAGVFSFVTLVVPEQFSAAPEKYAVWAIGKSGQTVKPFRVMGISKSGDLDVKISAIEYNETVYNVDTDGKVLPTPAYSQTQVLPLVTNLSVDERIEYANKYQVERYLDVTFSKPLGTYSRLHVYFNKDGTGWKSWGYVNGSFSIPGIEADTQYEITITTVGKDGRESNLRSAPKYLILTSTNSPSMPANPYMVSGVQGLGLKGGGLTSNTRNFHLAWDSFASAWTPALWFKHFKVEVLTTGLVLLRTEYTTSFEFIYTYEFAKADGFYRDVVFKVYVVDQDGNESPDQSITISNPQVGQVQNVTVDGGYLGATVKWDAIDADDLAGYQVLLSTDGINYGIASRVGPGTTSATFSALPGGTIYAKVGAYDYFGESGITYSVSASATVNSAAPATDPESFRKDATETFDVPILDGHSFAAGISSLSWNAHDLYHNGTKYPIASGSTGFKYVWWDVLSPSAYQSSDTKPTLDQSAGQFHIAVYYGADDFDLVWHAAPNQVVGSLYVQRASINTAHIDHIDASTANITNIWADKIKVGGSPVYAGGLAAKDTADYVTDVTGGPPADADKTSEHTVSGSNLLRNSAFLESLTGWNIYVDPAYSGEFTLGRNLSADWTLSGEGTAFIVQSGTSNITATMYSTVNIPVVPGNRYEASVYIGPHRCGGYIYIEWKDSNNVILGTSGFSDLFESVVNTGGKNLSGYTRVGVFGIAPSGTSHARIIIAKTPTMAGQIDSYLFVSRVYFGEAAALQQVLSAWVSGPTGDETSQNTAYDTQNVGGQNANTVRDNAAAGATFTSSNAGAMAYEDLVEAAKLGSTIISGGYIRSNLLTADNIVAGTLVVGTASNNIAINTSENKIKYTVAGTEVGTLTGQSGNIGDGISVTSRYFGAEFNASPVFPEASFSNWYFNVNPAGGASQFVLNIRGKESTGYSNAQSGIKSQSGAGGTGVDSYGGILGVIGKSSPSSSSAIGVKGTGYHGVWGGEVDKSSTYGGVFHGSLRGATFNSTDIGIISQGTTYYGVLADGGDYCFYANTGTFAGGPGSGSYGPFTGAHDGIVVDDEQIETGDILIDSGMINKATVSDVIGFNTRSVSPKQKSVFGVFIRSKKPKSNPVQTTTIEIDEDGNEVEATETQPGTTQGLIDALNSATTYDEFMDVVRGTDGLPSAIRERKFAPLDDSTFGPVRDYFVSLIHTHSIAIINAVGEGCVNVVAEGGDIEIGDYICSSSTPGKGMRQNLDDGSADSILRNYTVAKARESVSWTQEEIDNNVVKLVACSYHCG